MTKTWPKQDYTSMTAFYGNVGQNQTQLLLPYPMRLAWDTSKTICKISCHKEVHDSLGEILSEIYGVYGNDLDKLQKDGMDLFGGCLNVRKVRGGDSWSIHSWGAAIDLDPAHNTLSMHRDRAAMPNQIIDIFVSKGWTSMGRSRNYDFMHFQAASL